jgi:[lysine-biosynthesis-protein LysW]--L-2-aminoadipate ligase
MPSPAPDLPVVLKPRFGSWGRDVQRCETREQLDAALEAIARREWFQEHGVLAQELVPPVGWDLRLVVAGDRVVGAARRVPAAGEWRTNAALGAMVEPVDAPPLARTLALAAARAVRADLAGVDLLPTRSGFVVLEVNGAVEFRPVYAPAADIYADALVELLRTVAERRAVALVGA